MEFLFLSIMQLLSAQPVRPERVEEFRHQQRRKPNILKGKCRTEHLAIRSTEANIWVGRKSSGVYLR